MNNELEERRIAGKKGGIAKAAKQNKAKLANATFAKQTVANAGKTKQSVANLADNVNVNDNATLFF